MPSYLGNWVGTLTPITAKDATYSVTFDWDAETMGVPGAFIIRNYHHSEFYLKNLTLYDYPGHACIHFYCNLIDANGIVESTVYPRNFVLEMSSAIYKDWNFTEQALPADLLERISLVIKDYPFAVDGLEIWSAIETWVTEYCHFYYSSDQVELIQACTTIIWVASALHAAVNFGQYPYAGFLPNRPTVSRFMPEAGSKEYDELAKNRDLTLLTITPQDQTMIGVSLIEILSRHSVDEIYLGKRDSTEWTSDEEPLAAFQRFRDDLVKIEKEH
ncbi:polyphenol oxidase [Hibiscus syriacus]|uniref:Polyphenol oxidase n=1 Tax=Hibiscus syriacus TaxID=106335 RepID=A0A6A3AEQ6_HIBSY|nr:polyphenol oxidase [Hibiscus syriacus]